MRVVGRVVSRLFLVVNTLECFVEDVVLESKLMVGFCVPDVDKDNDVVL